MVLSTNAFLFLSDQARKAMQMHPDRHQVFDLYPSETKNQLIVSEILSINPKEQIESVQCRF